MAALEGGGAVGGSDGADESGGVGAVDGASVELVVGSALSSVAVGLAGVLSSVDSGDGSGQDASGLNVNEWKTTSSG